MTAVVQAATAVEQLLGRTPVVVGGLAVMCRLDRAYRATVDLDLVERLHESQVPQSEVLRLSPGTNPVDPSAVEVETDAGMVKVDVIQVNQAEIDHPSDDPGDRLHATSHAWALDTATPLEITSVDRADVELWLRDGKGEALAWIHSAGARTSRSTTSIWLLTC